MTSENSKDKEIIKFEIRFVEPDEIDWKDITIIAMALGKCGCSVKLTNWGKIICEMK